MSEELTEDELLAQALASMDSNAARGGLNHRSRARCWSSGTNHWNRAFWTSWNSNQWTSHRSLPGGTAKPGVARVGRKPPPESQNRLRALSNSVWFSSPTEVKCYCRVMFLVSWSTKEPKPDNGLRRDVSRSG